jgi:hypothetical protein
LIILFKIFQGRSQGAVGKLGRLCSLVLGILGAVLIKNTFTQTLSDRFVQPFFYKLMTEQLEKLGLADVVESLVQVFENMKLPVFLQSSVSEQVASANNGINTAIGSAATIIAERLTGWLLFAIGFAAIYLILKLIFDGMLDPLIRKIPIMNSLNSLIGAVLGALIGIVTVGLLLVVLYIFVPSLHTGEDALLSPQTVEASYILKLYFRALPGILS